MMLAIIMVAAIIVAFLYLAALFKEMIIARRRSKHG